MKINNDVSYISTPGALSFFGSLSFIVCGAFFLPTTYDETARINDYVTFISNMSYDYHWPLGLLCINLINPIYDGSVLSVRLFSVFLTIPFLFLACIRIKTLRHIILFLSLVPIVCSIVSTATPQGYMLSALGALLFTPQKSIYTAPIFSILYLINPTCIVLIPISLLLVAVRDGNYIPFKASVIGYLMTTPIIFGIFLNDGIFLPTFSSNGMLNLFLGNNPHPLSFRGVGTTSYVQDFYALPNKIAMSDSIRLFFTNDPMRALLNLIKKVLHFWAPWDHLRSNFGGKIQYAFFVYVALVQLIILQQFFSLTTLQRKSLYKSFPFTIIIVSCLIYSIFFVKLRFRLPFDVILLIFICFSDQTRRADS